jgi:cytochrome b561
MRVEILFFHKSIGDCLWTDRASIVWRLIVGAPAYAEPLGKVIQVASRAGHFALYALMIAMPVSGYWGRSRVGGRFTGSGCSSSKARGRIVVAVAAGLGAPGVRLMLAFALAAHLGAVVLHNAIKHDSVLTRMWPSFRPASSSGAS